MFSRLASPPRAHVRGAFELSVATALFATAILPFASGLARPGDSNYLRVVRQMAAIVPPLLLREVDPETALSINSGIPFSSEPNPPARPFEIRGNAVAYDGALQCLSEAIYYEAGGETHDGQRAVAQIVLNRVRHPAFSNSVCAVIYEGSARTTGCQFSFTCDGSLRRRPTALGWARARSIAEEALSGAVFKPVGNATHYHADYVVPYWATSLAKNAVIGTHIFYRWRGWWGEPAAFAERHSGNEADAGLLRNAALQKNGIDPSPPSWSAEELVLGPDPRVELISIIQLLAARSPPRENATQYENEVREQFSGYSDHLAVEIYRQLSATNSKFSGTALLTLMRYSPPPSLDSKGPLARELVNAAGGKQKLDGFMSALRDFVQYSDFDSFFRKQEPYYAGLTLKAREPTSAMAAALEHTSGLPVHGVKFILAPLLSNSGTVGCQAVPERDSKPWVIVGFGSSSKQAFNKPTLLKEALVRLSESECLSSFRPAVGSGRRAGIG